MKAAHLGRVLRTVAHLRPTQIVSQLRYLFNEERRAGAPLEQTPERSIERAFVPFLDAPAHARYDGALGFELLRRKHRFRDHVDWDFEGHGPLGCFIYTSSIGLVASRSVLLPEPPLSMTGSKSALTEQAGPRTRSLCAFFLGENSG